MKTSNFKIVYCSNHFFEQFKNEEITIGELLMAAGERLRGGLDHFVETKKQVKMFDRGMNGLKNDLIVRAGKF